MSNENVLEEYRRECEEMRLAGMIWWLVLWYASDEGRLEIPSEQQWLACELVATLIEEVEDRKFYYSWRHDRTNREQVQEWDEWPSYVNAQLDKCRTRNPNAFSDASVEGQMRDLLKRFVQYKFSSDHDEKDWMSELKIFHEQAMANSCRQSKIVPRRELYDKADKHLCSIKGQRSKEFWCALPSWCREIGVIMRPYIERDLAYIRKHYSW